MKHARNAVGTTPRWLAAAASAWLIAAGAPSTGSAAPPPPSGEHPRLFLGAENLAGFTRNAGMARTAAANMVAECQKTIDTPQHFTARGGAGGGVWPQAAFSCAFAYRVTQKAAYHTQAQKYLRAAIEDDQTVGDKLGCVAGVNLTAWKTWNGNPPAPAAVITITHDTGYPMRWYGPFVALAYDWLSGTPGVDTTLLGRTRECLGNWVDYYTARGYLREEPGANYNAGYVVGKTFAAIAIGTDGGADGHLWTETVDTLFPKVLIADGLAGASGPIGAKAGALVGGDWAEGWQYGPLSVLEYAVAARALEEHGVALPEMDAWVGSLVLRTIHGTVPKGDGQWVGGDFEPEQVYQSLNANQIDTVLAGPSSPKAAAWAAFLKQRHAPPAGIWFYNALAELRDVTPEDYRAQSPAPPLWYVARGTRNMYVRSDWTDRAFWAVYSSAPPVVADHQHFSASNFVFTRGGDHLIVDSSNYGEMGTFETNAITIDTGTDWVDYRYTQTPWSEAELVWARGTQDGVFAASSDLTRAWVLRDQPNKIPYAHREWVMLSEGAIITIDRARTPGAANRMYVRFHANTAGTLALQGSSAIGTVGGSRVAIHRVSSTGGTPAITKPRVGTCTLSCNFPCGSCDAARFPVDRYSLEVPGPWATAIHVIDGLGSGESPAIVGSINDDAYDPEPKKNGGVIGAAVFRASKQTYVVASSAQDAVVPTMTYRVPGTSASRHVVFDAPEDANGQAKVDVTVEDGHCRVTITAGAGFAGRPLMFGVAAAENGCAAVEDTNVAPGLPPPGGGSLPPDGGPGPGAGGSGGGCAVGTHRRDVASGLGTLFIFAVVAAAGQTLKICVASRRAAGERARERSRGR